MHKYLLLLIAVLFTTQASAQAYNTTIGVRIGEDYGATVQQRITKKMTLEGIYYGGFNRNIDNPNVNANLLLKRHFPVLSRRTNIYAGIGIGSQWILNDFDDYSLINQQFTIPAIFGLEFSLGRLSISGDVMPHYLFESSEEKSFKNIAGLSVRYILVKKKPGKKFIDKIEDKLPELDKNKKKKKTKN